MCKKIITTFKKLQFVKICDIMTQIVYTKGGYIMNETQVQNVEKQQNSQTDRISAEERRIIAEKRYKRRRARKIKNTIFFSVCAVLIILCVSVIAHIMTDDRETSYAGLSQKHAQETNGEVQTIYSGFPYYKSENLQRYHDYAAQNPQYSPEDVVWRVNAQQDKPKYNYDIPVNGYDDVCIIVNKYYKVPDDYKPADLTSVDGQKLRSVAASAYINMKNDALKEGLKIRVVSGYRTVEYQRGLYNRYLSGDSQENVDRYSARPGYSEHHTGLAMDLFGSQDGLRQFENTPEFPWVRDNCYKYGFIIRYLEETEDITGYESEPWHLRYVGVDVSTDMKEKNINNFEEYHAKYLQ